STIPSSITSIPLLETLQDDFPQGCIGTLINVVTSIPTCELLGPFEPLAPLITVTESIKNNPRELLKYLTQIDESFNDICSAPICADKVVQDAIPAIEFGCKTDLNNKNTIMELIYGAIAVADQEQVCTRCNKDIINAFDNFLKNNTFALQVLDQSGINQTSIDTMKIGIAVKCGIKVEDC
ncbi:33309_t:CDS:2, partial [Gigaspora margarita]